MSFVRSDAWAQSLGRWKSEVHGPGVLHLVKSSSGRFGDDGFWFVGQVVTVIIWLRFLPELVQLPSTQGVRIAILFILANFSNSARNFLITSFRFKTGSYITFRKHNANVMNITFTAFKHSIPFKVLSCVKEDFYIP